MIKFTTNKVNNMLHDGFNIVYMGELKGIRNKSYKATLIDGCKILVEVPSVPFQFLDNHEEYAKILQTGKRYVERIADAHEAFLQSDLSRCKTPGEALYASFP